MRLPAGMRTPSKVMVRVGWAHQPIFSSLRPYFTPAASAGTRKQEIPLAPLSSPVRAMTISTSVAPAPEIKHLLPSST
ncbi:hypothetical protein D3C86_1753570 [compost metagenome]